jgi:hypothetical protein
VERYVDVFGSTPVLTDPKRVQALEQITPYFARQKAQA